MATVSADGSVSVVPKWFAFADPDTLPDKGSLLLQAQAEESHAYWARAASFYSQALTSTDPNVRAGAEQGYLNAREKIHSSHIFKKEAFAAGVLLLLFVIGGVATVRHRRGRLVIETPSKITPDAPVDLFASAIITSALEIQATFRAEEQQRNRIVSLLQDSSDQKVFMLSGGAHAIQQIADSLPDIRGVKAGNLVKALFAGFNFLFNWRIESGLAIYADGSGSAYANLRWWWSTTSTWVESVSIPATTLAEEPPRAVVIRSLAWRIASDILSKDLTSRHGS